MIYSENTCTKKDDDDDDREGKTMRTCVESWKERGRKMLFVCMAALLL